MRIKKLNSDIKQIKNFLHKTDIKVSHFILPIFLSFAAALFDGLSIGLLVPMAKGIIGMDFAFIRNLPVFKTIVSYFPRVFIHTSSPNSSIFILLLGIIFTSTVLKNVLSYFSQLTANYQARRFSKNMRDIIFSRYLNFGKLFFDRANIGQLNTILLQFTHEIARLLTYLRDAIANIFTLIVYLVIMWIISWKLTIFALLLFPTLYYSINWLIKKIKATSKSYAESRIKQAWRIFDILLCLPLLKSYAREDEEKKHFSKLSNSVAQLEFSIDKKLLLINPIQEIIVITVLLFIIAAMAFIFIKGYTGVISGFLVFFYILRKSAPLFNSLNTFKGRLAEAAGSIRNALRILDDKDKFIIPEGNKTFDGLKEKIEFRNLRFSYIKKIQILKDISFFIEKGKMTAIVGPTGSGKTTLINLILRFYDSAAGSIFVDGTDIRNFMLKSLRTHIALVSQDTLLFNDTIKNNVLYGLDRKVSGEKLAETTKSARLYDFITALPDKFDTLIGDRGIKLSGGEKQRLSIARALLKGSEILILDEATSSLDSRTERLIQEAIDEAIKDKTAIVIAHRLSTIRRADKVVVIEHGKLIEQGSLDELLNRKGKFSEYWQEQKFY